MHYLHNTEANGFLLKSFLDRLFLYPRLPFAAKIINLYGNNTVELKQKKSWTEFSREIREKILRN